MFSGSSHQTDQRLREGYDSASTAPRSTEGSISEDVFTESELSPIREERQSTEELQQENKSSGASSQSVQTLLQEPQTTDDSHTEEEEEEKKPEEGEPASDTAQPSTSMSSKQPSTPTSKDHQQPPHCQTEGVATSSGSQSLAPGADEATGQERSPDGAKLTRDGTRDSETDVEELRKMWKSHTMQQAMEQRESVQQAQRENDQQPKDSQRLSSAEGTRTCPPISVFLPFVMLSVMNTF